MDWSPHVNRYKYSVLEIRVVYGVYNAMRPYQSPNDKGRGGTGFIVDISKGYVLTNAHVLDDALSITVRSIKTGRKKLTASLVGICPSKDLAICKLSKDSIEELTSGMEDPTKLNMPIGDHMALRQADEVMAIGYPLGDEIKYTTGIISGFHSKKGRDLDDIEDSYSRPAFYVQITAALNPGNSGGPLINTNGEVVGINSAGTLFAQNTGYAVGSRTYMAISKQLINGGVLRVPTWGMGWCPSSDSLSKHVCGGKDKEGIYIRSVLPDSFLPLKEGDILSSVIHNTNRFVFDRHGSVTMLDSNGNNLLDRTMTIAEMVDIIPIGDELEVSVCREGEDLKLSATNSCVITNRIPTVVPSMEPFEFEVFAGLVVCDMTWNHVNKIVELECDMLKMKKRYKKRVVIVQVLPNTEAGRLDVFSQGDLLYSVNGTKVFTISGLREVLNNRSKRIKIITRKRGMFIADWGKSVEDDLVAMERFNIPMDRYTMGRKDRSFSGLIDINKATSK